MSKSKKAKPAGRSVPSRSAARRPKRGLALLAVVVMVGSAAVIFWSWSKRERPPEAPIADAAPVLRLPTADRAASDSQPSPSPTAGAEPALTTMSVAQAVMVTVELDFGPRPPSIAEALKEILRGYAPDDGQGRTFAILDAYGEPTADGKLHLSMHVSSEKPGRGTLTFKRTGALLWQARIGQPTDAPAPAKNLMISLDNGAGRSLTLDGSRGGPSVLDVMIKDATTRVRDLWPDGAEREVTFVYSACGCPVKVMAKRVGEKTVRTKDTPVIFPDDPAAVSTISQLMGWGKK